MIIHIEGFDQNNNYINKNINPQNKKIKELSKWTCYDWYKDGIKLDENYNGWKDDDNYEIIFNQQYINLYIKIKNKIIMTPLICKTSTIEELKNILSIKDNIYFNQVKLKDNNTLDDYDINNLDSLTIQHNIYSSAALDC
jgi:hypothetical protein